MDSELGMWKLSNQICTVHNTTGSEVFNYRVYHERGLGVVCNTEVAPRKKLTLETNVTAVSLHLLMPP